MNDDQTLNAVTQLLATMIGKYREIESSVKRIMALDPASPETQRELRRVDIQRASIQSYQKDYRQLHAMCTERRITSQQVKNLSRELRELVEGLIESFAVLEDRTRDSKKKLLPVVNENVRAARMQSAYNRRAN